jgi:hypothetical protein
MGLRTNLDKWNYWLGLINSRTKEFIGKEFPEVPKQIYRPRASGYTKALVESIDYRHTYFNEVGREIYVQLYFRGNKPDKGDVKNLKDYYELNLELNKESIIIRYAEELDNGFILRGGAAIYSEKTGFVLDESEAISLSEVMRLDSEEQNRLNELYGKSFKPEENGFKNLGWQNGWVESPSEFQRCIKTTHKRVITNLGRCYNQTLCPTCKIYWSVDSSD